MGKISERITNRTAAPKVHWRDSSLFAAVVAAASTAGFMYAVVLPILTTSLNAKLEALAPIVDRVSQLESELNSSKSKLAATEIDLQEAKRQLSEAKTETPFVAGSAYPNGIDKIKIGDSFTALQKAYQNGKLDEELGYYSVKFEHPIFRSVTYYLDESKRSPRVEMILFHVAYNSPLKAEGLRERIAALHGTPQQTASKGRSWWNKLPRESIELSDSGLYTLYSKTTQPNWVR